jgi:rubrerythrin
MKDQEILTEALELERKTITRLKEQIGITPDESKLELIESMLQDHTTHFNEIVRHLKMFNPKIKEKELSEIQTEEPDPEEMTKTEEIDEEMNDDFEEEQMLASQYEGFADEMKDPSLRALMEEFAEDEIEHAKKLKRASR